MNLTYADNVKKTPAITRAIGLLDPYFDGEPSVITSGWRAPLDQVRIISDKAKRHGVDAEFPEFLANHMQAAELIVKVEDSAFFWWQRTWSRLLNIGDIVNPPVPATCLFDYTRPGDAHNKKGEIIQVSPHQRGTAFDIGGGDPSRLLEKAKRVMKAYQDGGCFLKEYLVEKINNAVHCDVVQIG